MAKASAITLDFANSRPSKTGTRLTQIGATNAAIINAIRDIYNEQTVPTLAAWLKVSLRTAKNRLLGEREFTLDEVATLLQSEHGLQILSALMSQAKRKPRWWTVCEPLMRVADAERFAIAIRKQVTKTIEEYDDADQALETEIRRAEALAIHGSGPARFHADALRSRRGVLAKGR